MHSTERASFDRPGCNPGLTSQHNVVALKGRDSGRGRGPESRPFRATVCSRSVNPGRRPGLWNMTPLGSKAGQKKREKKQGAMHSTEGASFDSPGVEPWVATQHGSPERAWFRAPPVGNAHPTSLR